MAFKAYWALMNRSGTAFCTADGIPTTVTFGFLRSLMALLEQEQPAALIVAFDTPTKSFRHDRFGDYKAQRAKTPPNFSPDLTNLQQLLRFLRIQTVSAPGYEADDAMAGVAQQGSKAGYTVHIYTNDQDLWQVVDDANHVGVLVPAVASQGARKGKGQQVATLIDEAAVREKLSIMPAQVPDFKALVGDAADNLPGIKNVGPKTAARLLQQYGSLEALFQGIAALKPAEREKLKGHEDSAMVVKDLARVRPESAPSIDFSSCHLRGFSAEEVKPLLQRLEMTSLVKALPQLQQLLGGSAPPSGELTAAIPEALTVFSSAAAAPAQTTVLQDVTAVDGAKGSELPFVQGSKCYTGPISLLPDSLQARLPIVNVVASHESLQQLLEQLQNRQGPITWTWPQSQPYTPGSAAPFPSFVCCAWNMPVHVKQTAAAQAASTAAAVPVASASTTAGDMLTELVAENRTGKQSTGRTRNTTAAAPRRRSSRPASGTTVAAAAAVLPSAHNYQQQARQVLQPMLAVIKASDQLPGSQVLTALQPLMQDESQPKVLFESKRCYTEMHHWGIQLAGVQVDVLVAGYLLDPERWTESSKVKALDPERQQHQALPCMARDVLNTTLPDMQAALAASHHQQILSSIDLEQGQATPHHVAAGAAEFDDGRSSIRSRRRLSRRTTKSQTEAAASPEQISPPLATASTTAQAPQMEQIRQPNPQQLQQQHWQPQQQELPAAMWHAAAEAWASHMLCGAFLQQLQQLDDGGKLLRLFQSVELPVQRVLSHMEVNGMGLNMEALIQNRSALQAQMAQLEGKLFGIAGRTFNLSSRQTLSQVIYQELNIKPKTPELAIPTTATGMKSTREEDIRKLEEHPFVASYLQWISLNTLLTKYYSGAYMNAVNPNTGRVHTTLAQVGSATGRIHSVNPNMQNIPAHVHSTRFAAAFRDAFNCPQDGFVLVSADYSQVELRVLAALAQDEALLHAFAAGIDVHEATARVLLDKDPQEMVSAAERQLGKRVNFSIVYGAGKGKIAQDAGVTPQEAKKFLEKFYAAYPRLHEFMNNCHSLAVAKGCTQSILGRRRLFRFQGDALRRLLGTQDLSLLPEMRKLMFMGNKNDAQVLRQAGNAPIQGTSADVLKVALCKLHSVLTTPPWSCRLLLTVHDSVVVEVPKAQWPSAKDVIKSAMENVLPEQNLKLMVDVKEGW